MENCAPLRVCYGKELMPSRFGDNYIIYGNDTATGNSGSPVLARGGYFDSDNDDEDEELTPFVYKVKAIHLGKQNVKKWKRYKHVELAQHLRNLGEWIRPRNPSD